MNYHEWDPTRGLLKNAAAVLVCIWSASGCGAGNPTGTYKNLQSTVDLCPGLNQPCMSTLGCEGTVECTGGTADCKAPLRNNCGICGAPDEAKVGEFCLGPGGRNGVQVCGAGGGTVCATTVLSLTVDDTFVDAPRAAAAFEAHGIRGTFFVNSPRFAFGPNYMSRDQVLALQMRGHEIGGHTLDHPHLDHMSADQQKREICHDRAELLAAGFDIKNFAFPFGADKEDKGQADRTAQACNYNSARTIGGISHDQVLAEPLPSIGQRFAPRNPFSISTPSSVKIDTPLERIVQYVTDAEMEGGWIIINMHHICEGAECDDPNISASTIRLDTLNAFLDWFVGHTPESQGTTVTQTLRQMVWGPTLPPVDATLSQLPPGTQLLPNADLEDDLIGHGVPDCWEYAGGGHNDIQWFGGQPHSGFVAVDLLVREYLDGARGLMTRRQWSSCTPQLVPGHQYTLRAWYIAPENTPLFQIDYFRDGGWLTWLFSPRFPKSSSYAQATWNLPPVPVDATVDGGTLPVSVGLMLNAVGSLTVDDLDLVEEEP